MALCYKQLTWQSQLLTSYPPFVDREQVHGFTRMDLHEPRLGVFLNLTWQFPQQDFIHLPLLFLYLFNFPFTFLQTSAFGTITHKYKLQWEITSDNLSRCLEYSYGQQRAQQLQRNAITLSSQLTIETHHFGCLHCNVCNVRHSSTDLTDTTDIHQLTSPDQAN